MEIFWDTIVTWSIPAGFVLGGLAVGILVEFFGLRMMRRTARKRENDQLMLLATSLKRIISLGGLTAGLYIAVEYLHFDPHLKATAYSILAALATFVGVLFIARLAEGFINVRSKKDPGSIPAASLISHFLKVLILAVGIIFILHDLGIQISPVIAGLGIGGLAAALALQDTLSNLFAGFQIIASKQVRVGDWIRLDSGAVGQVQDITWRNVTILSYPEENLIIIPNSNLANSVMVNFNMPRQKLFERIYIGVAYGSDLDLVEKVSLETAVLLLQDMKFKSSMQPKFLYNGFGDFSINFELRLPVPSLRDIGRYRHEFIKRLNKRFIQEGIEIPFPIRTLYMHDKK